MCVSAVNDLTAQKEVLDDFLVKGKITLTKSVESGQTDGITVDSINNAFLIATSNVMVALVDVTETENNKGNTVLAKYVETKGTANWGDEAIKESNTNTWNTELATAKNKKAEISTAIKSHAVTVNNNKTYYITVSNDMLKDNEEPSEDSGSDAKWYVRVVIGEFTGESETGKKMMKWSTPVYSNTDKNSKLENEPNTKLNTPPPSDDFAFVTEDEKKVIFVMKGKYSKSNTNKNVVAFYQLDKSDGNNKFELFCVEPTANYYPLFFQWEVKMFKTHTDDQSDNNNKVMVFDTAKKKFLKK